MILPFASSKKSPDTFNKTLVKLRCFAVNKIFENGSKKSLTLELALPYHTKILRQVHRFPFTMMKIHKR